MQSLSRSGNTSNIDTNATEHVPARKQSRSCFRSCLVALLILVAVPTLLYWFVFPAPKYIGTKPYGKSYSATKFEFRYGYATRFVDDPHNKMQWVFGALPDSITVDDAGLRLIVYNSHNAIIKSWTDSMEVYDDSFRHKGYMGIWDDEHESFVVDSSGTIE
jgi:hypothetical protein